LIVEIGDKVIRTFDGRMGKVEQQGTVPGYCMVRFDDTGFLLPVLIRDLRVLELIVR
jgi:hypothetical protein